MVSPTRTTSPPHQPKQIVALGEVAHATDSGLRASFRVEMNRRWPVFMTVPVAALLALNGCADARGVRATGSPSSVDASTSAAVTSSETRLMSSPAAPSEANSASSPDICGPWDEANARTGKLVAAQFGDQR